MRRISGLPAIALIAALSTAAAQSSVDCKTAADCACGRTQRGECEIAHPAELTSASGDCELVCLQPLCVASRCERRETSLCPLDCDADLETTVDEILLGVDIVLG